MHAQHLQVLCGGASADGVGDTQEPMLTNFGAPGLKGSAAIGYFGLQHQQQQWPAPTKAGHPILHLAMGKDTQEPMPTNFGGPGLSSWVIIHYFVPPT